MTSSVVDVRMIGYDDGVNEDGFDEDGGGDNDGGVYDEYEDDDDENDGDENGDDGDCDRDMYVFVVYLGMERGKSRLRGRREGSEVLMREKTIVNW